jgi:serine/threonine protein phosphatase PrpC
MGRAGKAGAPARWEELPARGIFVEQDLAAPRLFEFPGGRAALFSSRCPGLERPNQDGAALLRWREGGGVVLVADGVGGGPGGAKAAKVALQAVAASVVRAREGDAEARTGILDGFEAANRRVLELGTGAATTLTAVELQQGRVRIYHVGDSEAALVGQRGKVKLQIVSHTPSGYGLEAGLLSEGEAIAHDERHVVLNHVGSPAMRIDVGPSQPMSPRDTLIVGSDGLFDNWRRDAIVERIRRGPLPRVAAELARETLRRMGDPEAGPPVKPDDVTFVLLRRRS